MLNVTLTDINKKNTVFRHPIKAVIIRSDDAAADGAVITLSVKGPVEEIAAVEVFSDGESIFYGFVDEQTEKYDGSGRIMQIKARSMQAVLLDNEALPQTYCLPSFGLIFERHFRPLGFSDFIAPEISYNGELVISKGMSEWDVLSDFCDKFSGVRPVIKRDGVIDILNGKKQKHIFISRGKVISYIKKFRRSALISDVMARTFRAGGYQMQISGSKAQSIGVKRKRYINMLGSKLRSITDVRDMVNRTESAYESVEIEYSGCINADTGDLLTVGGDGNSYKIKEVQITEDKSGLKTKIFAEVTKDNVDKQEYSLPQD